MQASRFEYQFRYLLHGVIYALGLWSPWLRWTPWNEQSTWHVAMTYAARTGAVTFDQAALGVLVLSLLLTGLGAALRVWGAAYVGSAVVKSHRMHGERMLADGPYRRTRNPLYLGTLVHTFGILFLMPPSGALLVLVLIWVLQVRLALAEEPFLEARFGAAYVEYKREVPRFLPAVTPRVPAGGARPHWGQAVVGELYMIGVFVTLAGFGWSFNAFNLVKGIVISLGVSLVARALLPRE